MPFLRLGSPLARTLAVALVAWLLGASLAAAEPAWPAELEGRVLPVEAIQPGMRGTAYTVVQGTRVEPFDVTFLGVLPGVGPAGDLLLVETSGPLIERTGGIVSGMSGSPVYVGGKLVGAIAYGFSYADHRVGMVTPIADMVEVLERIQEAAAHEGTAPFSEIDGLRPLTRRPRQVVLASDAQEAESLTRRLSEGTAVMVPLATPLMAGGFGARTFDLLSRWADRLPGGPFVTVPAGSAPASAEPGNGAPLQPGSAFGVQLLRGDVDLAALGTVTWTNGRRFLGFGHAFLNRGSVAFVTTDAGILHTVTSVEMPFKLGVAGDVVGTLTQDRSAGVGGRLGETPEMVEVRVDVIDLDRPEEGEGKEFRFWSVEDPWLLPDLVAIGLLQALDRGIDRIGQGTARVRFALESDDLDQPLVRDNVFFSEADVSARALAEVMEGVELLASNPFEEVRLRRIDVTARITPEPQTAQIVSVRPQRPRVQSGDSLLIEVELQTYRGPREKKMIRLTIPPGTPEGKVQVTVRGGYYTGPSQVVHAEILDEGDDSDSGEEEFETLPEGASLEELLEAFRTRERNYELVAEFYPPFAPFTGQEPDDNASEASPPEPGTGRSGPSQPAHEEGAAGEVVLPDDDKPVQARLATDYVIRGSDQFELEIVAPGAPQETEDSAESGLPSGS